MIVYVGSIFDISLGILIISIQEFIMKRSSIFSGLILATLSLVFTGCYTQLRSTDFSPQSKSSAANGYYSWDDDERADEGNTYTPATQTSNYYSEQQQ